MARPTMTPDASSRRPQVIGRDDELSRMDLFLDGLADGPAALVLEGESGIGKTTLWKRGVAGARERGYPVFSIRPPSQRRSCRMQAWPISSTASTTNSSPRPAQQQALEVALLHVEPSGSPLDPRAVFAAVLSVFREVVVAGSARGRARRRPMARPLDDRRAPIRGASSRYGADRGLAAVREPDRRAPRRGSKLPGGTTDEAPVVAAIARPVVRPGARPSRRAASAVGPQAAARDVGRQPVLRAGDRASDAPRRSPGHRSGTARPADPPRRSRPRPVGRAPFAGAGTPPLRRGGVQADHGVAGDGRSSLADRATPREGGRSRARRRTARTITSCTRSTAR